MKNEYYDALEKFLTRGTDKSKKRRSPRVVVKRRWEKPENAKRGRIQAIIGSRCFVVPNENSGKGVSCVPAGVVVSPNENQSLLAVGDYVYFIPDERDDSAGVVVAVERRRSQLARKDPLSPIEKVAAANVDLSLIFTAAKNPRYKKGLIDRYLVASELNLIEPIICVNKIDLVERDALKKDFAVYEKMDYKVFFLSAKEKIGIREIKDLIAGKDSVLAGPSGAGKSTFLNAVFGKEYQKVKSISEKTKKGKHTTSYVKMFPLPSGGNLIDTPGIREFAIWGLDKKELWMYFRDFRPFAEKCKIRGCRHLNEPGCAVLEAVENGQIDAERYASYLNLYRSMD